MATEGAGSSRGRPLANGETDKAALIARAYQLSIGQDSDYEGITHSSRGVARVLDISQATAAKYIAQGAAGAQWVDQIERNAARMSIAQMLHRADEWIQEAATLADQRAQEETGDGAAVGDKSHLVAPLVKVADRLAKLTGADAPTRVQNEHSDLLIGPGDQDAAIAAAVLRERQRNAKRRAALDSGDTVDVHTNGDGAPPGGPETNGDG